MLRLYKFTSLETLRYFHQYQSFISMIVLDDLPQSVLLTIAQA
jgi:hypothetical protein